MKRNYLHGLIFLCIFIISGKQAVSSENGFKSPILDNSKDAGTTPGSLLSSAQSFAGSLSLSPCFRINNDKDIIYPTMAGPNLIPYQPAGWDDRIVVSTVTGTSTSAVVIYDTQDVYIDWSVSNSGTVGVSLFYTGFYIDGELITSFKTDGLNMHGITSGSDYPIGKLTAGTHTLRIVADVTRIIDESNESDNDYTRTITVVNNNLTPYQPAGWDNKLVVSTTSGTTTSTATVFNNQALYVDWAVINNGSAAIRAAFYTRLYVDGVLKNSWHTTILNAGSHITIADYNIGALTSGTHTLRIVTDADGTLEETDETDNEYSRTITVYPDINLANYKPIGTETNKIIIRTGIPDDPWGYLDSENLYLDWFIANSGTSDVTSSFMVKLYVDDVFRYGWSLSGLTANTSTSSLNFPLGKFPAGEHTFRVVVDANGNIVETDETDNEYSRPILVKNKDLTICLVPGGDDKIVLSTVENALASSPDFFAHQAIYGKWAIVNHGTATISPESLVFPDQLKSDISVDGDLKYRWTVGNILYPGIPVATVGLNLGIFPVGTHTVTVAIDTDHVIEETNEADNTYSRSITVYPNCNLTLYQPIGWDNKIVLSTVTETSTSSPLIYDTQSVYLDWAAINNGSDDLTRQFYAELYIDEVYKIGWISRGGLNSGGHSAIDDYNVGTLTAGAHVFKIVIDPNSVIPEINESDNEISRIISVLSMTLSPPVAIAATGVTQTVFSANWNTVTGATGYYLDVSATPAFDSFITGYNNKDVGNVVTSSITGLTAGTTYYYRIRACNTSLTSENSNTVTVLTVPPAPDANAATGITDTGFSANWNSSTGATGYYLDVSTSNTFSFFLEGYNNRAVGNVLTAPLTGLSYGTYYYYRVKAYNTSGTSGFSIVRSLVTLPRAPVAVSAEEVTQTGFMAVWGTQFGEVTGYRLDVSTDGSFASFVSGYNNKAVGNTNGSFVTGLLPGTAYHYRVRAYNISGTGGNSNVISVTTSTGQTPAAPVATAAGSITQSSFSANWVASPGATGYFLDVSTSSSFLSFLAGYGNKDVGAVTTSSVSGLDPGNTYYFRIRAYNPNGTSGNSNTMMAVTVPQTPEAYIVTASEITQISFPASWSVSSGATGYYLDVSTSDSFAGFVSGYNNKDVGNVNTSSVTGLTPGIVHYYRVRASNAGGTSGNSNSVAVYVKPPDPVATAATTITLTSFWANWNPSTGAMGYFIDVSTDPGFSSFIADFNHRDVFGNVSLQVTGLTAGTTYYYRVKAYNLLGENGNSGNSNVITVMTSPDNIPGVPVATAATSIVQSGFSANWNASSGATGYYLDVSASNAFTGFVTGYNNKDIGNSLTSPVTGLSPGVLYYYRVRAYNGIGTSGNSNVITVMTSQGEIPPPPVAIAASSITQSDFAANWNASSGASGYYLDISTSSIFADFLSGFNNKDVGNVLTYPVTGLPACTTLYYRVRAYNGNGTGGNSNSVTVMTLPAPPVANAATGITQTGFTANWNAVSCATGYYLDVSTSDIFSSFVTGYNNKIIGNVTTAPVTGLEASSGYYYRLRACNLTSTSANSNVIHVTTSGSGNHFTPVGNPTEAMNVTILEAKLDNTDLEAGDEIGIFDGEVCVGSLVLTQGLGELSDELFALARAYAAESGTTDGFIPGHLIRYRFWDQSAGAEVNDITSNCFSNLSVPVDCPVFETGSSAFVQLNGATSFTQVISFNNGWNIFSTYINPPFKDMKILFQPLIDDGSLVKIQDEIGRPLENLGVFGGWYNDIGDIASTEGYKIKVSRISQISITGQKVKLPFGIPLKTGWNIMGYPCSAEFDGLPVVQQLIDRGRLVKVQDKMGNAIEDMGIFGGWTNNIGNFKPGEGYKIKLKAADTLTVYESYPKSGGITGQETGRPDHFRTSFLENGVDHMNINLVALPLSFLSPSDEIAVFDGSICAGAVKLMTSQWDRMALSIPVSACDSDESPGFTEGNPFILKIWKSETGMEYVVDPEIIQGTPTFRKNESTLASLEKYAAAGFGGKSVKDEMEMRIFPNPTDGKIFIDGMPPFKAGFTVRITNSAGQTVMNRKIESEPGIIDLSGNVSGIYLVRITGKSFVETGKIMLR